MPAVKGKQRYKITQAFLQNATTATVEDASGNMQLVCTPALNYIVSDVVALTIAPTDSCQGNRPPHKERKGEHHPKLRLLLPHKQKHDKKDKATENNILINFNIRGDETITSVN